MNRRNFIAGVAAIAASASLPSQGMETVTHPDGKAFYRNSADQWMPL